MKPVNSLLAILKTYLLMYNLMKYYVIHVVNTLLKLNHIYMEMTE